MIDKSMNRTDWQEAFVNSGFMFLFMLIFSILGIIFIYVDKVYDWVQLLIGLGFSVPIMMIYYYNGSKSGAREFKRMNGSKLEDARRSGAFTPNLCKGLMYVLPYAGFSLLVAALSWAVNNQAFKMIVLFIFMPATVIGQSLGLIDFPRSVVHDSGLETEYVEIVGDMTSGAMVFTVVTAFVLVACLVYWIAYIRKIAQSKSQFSSFVTEIAENEKFRRK